MNRGKEQFIVMLITTIILILICVFLGYTVFHLENANATSAYEYIVDNDNLFDDSNDMIQMCKEIRNKLDFNIHIYSIKDDSEVDAILEKYHQDSSAFLILVSKEKGITWWSGSNVKKTIRDIDFDLIFERIKATSPKQYTDVVNKVLSGIIDIYISGNYSIDDFIRNNSKSNREQAEDNFFQQRIRDIKEHPIHLIGLFTFAILIILYYYKKNKSKS